MVAGADRLLSHVAQGDNRVTLHVVTDELADASDYIVLDQLDQSLTGGSHYTVSNTDFEGPIWICPVTLCVLGRYPKKLFFKRIG